MQKSDFGLFIVGVAGGIILGKVIDNMGIGLIVGFAIGLGLIPLGRRGPK